MSIVSPDLSQSHRFLTLLDEPAESWTFQTFDDNKDRKDKALAHIFHGPLEKHAETLKSLNAQGAGIFVNVNETNGKGRKTGDIVRVRALWREIDREGTPEPKLEPHIAVESSLNKFHYYYLVDGENRFDLFDGTMETMVQDYGSDPGAKDRARVLRLPGFLHCKDPKKPFLVGIKHESGAQVYSWDEVTAAVPPTKRPKQQQIPPGTKVENPIRVRSALAALNPDIALHTLA